MHAIGEAAERDGRGDGRLRAPRAAVEPALVVRPAAAAARPGTGGDRDAIAAHQRAYGDGRGGLIRRAGRRTAEAHSEQAHAALVAAVRSGAAAERARPEAELLADLRADNAVVVLGRRGDVRRIVEQRVRARVAAAGTRPRQARREEVVVEDDGLREARAGVVAGERDGAVDDVALGIHAAGFVVGVVAEVQHARDRVLAAGVVLVDDGVVEERVEIPLLRRRGLVEIVEQIPGDRDVRDAVEFAKREADARADGAGEIERARVGGGVRRGEVELHDRGGNRADEIRAAVVQRRRRCREGIAEQRGRRDFLPRGEAVRAAGDLLGRGVDRRRRPPAAGAAAAVVAAADGARRVRRVQAVDVHEDVALDPHVRAVDVEQIVVRADHHVVVKLEDRAGAVAAGEIEHIVVVTRGAGHLAEERVADDRPSARWRRGIRPVDALEIRARRRGRENAVAHDE